jgi:hypothetical protein
VAPATSATADNDREGGAAETKAVPSGATSGSKDRGGAARTRDGGGAAGVTNVQGGAADTPSDYQVRTKRSAKVCADDGESCYLRGGKNTQRRQECEVFFGKPTSERGKGVSNAD